MVESEIIAALISAVVVAGAATAIFALKSRDTSARIRVCIDTVEHMAPGAAEAAPAERGGTELDKLERALSNAERHTRGAIDGLKLEAARREAILSSMAEGVMAVDKDLRVIFLNETLARAVGAGKQPQNRPRLLEIVRDAEVQALIEEVISSGKQLKRSLKIAAARGRSFAVYAAPFDGASGRGAIAIFHDITDLERLEQVRKDFIANVSHEMRTPLATIIACSDTLLEGALEDAPNNRRFVEIIKANASRLNSISADLLVLSDLESGVIPGEPERISVREALDTAIRTVEAEAATTGVHLTIGVIEDLFVVGYRFRLEQALMNLLANAVKFNRPGGEVRATAQAENGTIRLAISDTGIGIPSQDLPRIFERFYRVDKARSKQVGGTGLGLSIVKHVIEAMGGSVHVESQLGKGSAFTLTLPAAPVASVTNP